MKKINYKKLGLAVLIVLGGCALVALMVFYPWIGVLLAICALIYGIYLELIDIDDSEVEEDEGDI